MKKILYLFMFLLLFVACEQTLENNDLIIPETNMAGEWTVNAYIDNNLIFEPFTVSTKMISNNESIIIKDNAEFWNFQVKADVLDSKSAFEAKSSLNEISSVEAKVNVLGGKIINNDSIVFDIQFEDDEIPYGFTYKIMGHRK